jgi:predicted acetyltransferase
MGTMSDPVSLESVTVDHRDVLERLWQLYSHDLSEIRGVMPDAEGFFRLGRLPLYLSEADRCGYLIRLGQDLAGFALLRGLDGDARVVGDFFVVRAARRRRVGEQAVRLLLDRHPGRWEIPFQEGNVGAARFWRSVTTEAVGSAWREERRPVPDKPALPPDTWILLDTRSTGRPADAGLTRARCDVGVWDGRFGEGTC